MTDGGRQRVGQQGLPDDQHRTRSSVAHHGVVLGDSIPAADCIGAVFLMHQYAASDE